MNVFYFLSRTSLVVGALASSTACGIGASDPDSGEPIAAREDKLLEPPQGVSRHVGKISLAVFEAQPGVPVPVAAVALASFRANVTNQYRTSYHLVSGGFCEKLWLTAPFEPTEDGEVASEGPITVSNPEQTLTLAPVGPGIYPPAIASPTMFAFGSAVTIAFSGLERTLTVPYPAAQVSPAKDALIGEGSALSLTWSGEATNHRQAVRYRLEQVVGDAPQPPNGASPPVERKLECYFDARRAEATIPEALLAFVRGHTVNTFFEATTTDLVLRLRDGHLEQVNVTVGNATQLRRLQLE